MASMRPLISWRLRKAKLGKLRSLKAQGCHRVLYVSHRTQETDRGSSWVCPACPPQCRIACFAIRFFVGCALIIQTVLLHPSRAVLTDRPSNVSSLDPSGAVQADAEHPTRNRKVVGSNPTSGSKTPGQTVFPRMLTVRRRRPVIPLVGTSRRHSPRFAT